MLKSTKILAIVGTVIVIVVIIAVAVVFTSDKGGGTENTGSLSGRYATIDDIVSLEFSDGNKIKMSAGSLTAEGTYTLDGNQLKYEWTLSMLDYTNYTKDETGYGTISDDKQEIIIKETHFVKK
jgi:hypothetical protein